ncbi:MAG: protein tyrosine phosphatase [Alphaproteobacteria bacterium]|nr:protein tyrosine phosphatase [Alphaproteobacteria bacterium]MBV9420189.1 protein tyrosine phosphatase [Alphaproteobacteria bacterium]MBV9540428.1 protein tyrosine phosphatase [Alphaproteobacteria bacterium]MBV9905158.1 protein tyrosine phosphatase [Alphaproteobacteria bacterium]
MPRILVTPLSAIAEAIRDHRPSHMITLLSPEHMIETPRGFPLERHLRIGVNDVVDVSAGDNPPVRSHMQQVIDFGRGWPADAPMLIHCWAGISRSMAATYAILCDRLGPGSEVRAAKAIRARAPHAYPNSLLVKYADDILGRQGRMVDAVRAIGAGTIVAEGEVVEFPLVGL